MKLLIRESHVVRSQFFLHSKVKRTRYDGKGKGALPFRSNLIALVSPLHFR